MHEPAALAIEEQGRPGLLALPQAIPEPHPVMLAAGVSAQPDEDTMARCLQPGLHGHAVAPARDRALAREVALLPLRQCLVPPWLEPAPRGR